MAIEPARGALPAGLSANAFSSLLQAVAGLRNRRALAALLGCLVVGILVSGLLVAMAPALGFLAAFLAGIFYFVAVATGVNAAGLLLMDQARGIAPRSLVDALVYGLMCIPKLIVLALALFAVEIAVFIVIAIVLFICKIPYLGPLLFVVAFPLSVVVAGLTIWGVFLCLVLSLPAIWQGATITRALAQTLAIARGRLVEAVLLLVFLGFICMAVAFIVFGLLFGGLLPALGMSAGIVGFGGFGAMGMGMGGVAGMMQGYGGGGAGHLIAGAIGFAVLWAVAASLVGLVYLLGLSLVYLRLIEGLDPAATEAALRAGLDEARRRTAELGERARAATRVEGSGAAPASVTPSPAPPAPAPAPADFEAMRAAAFGAAAPPPPPPSPSPPPSYAVPPPHPAPVPVATPPSASSAGTDIDLPFDAPVAPPPPSYGAPPAYRAPPVPPPPAAAPGVAPMTACPQCLSPVTPEDVFCAVCGYRLK